MRGNTISAALAAALLIGGQGAAFGQAAAINGQIEGTITDPSGAVISGAGVEALNQGTGFKRSAKTDEAGFFRFTVLPLGSYTVTVDASGFAQEKRLGIVLNAGSTVTLNIGMAVASVTRELEVTSAAPVVETGRTDIGSTLSSNEVANLPLLSRNNFNFILLQPNVSGHPNTEFGVPRKVNANGFTDRINYQLDGSNNTESDRAGIRLMPISNTWVQEVQQVNNGFAPEFGNTAGTVFNSITKSGTNAVHGEAAYIFRRTDFTARSPLLKPTDVKPTLNVDDLFADAGGRVIKDKLFWFGSFEKVKRDLPQPVTVTPASIAALGLPASYADTIPFHQDIYFIMGKADYQINDANRLSFRFNWFRNESPYNASSFTQILVTESYLFKDRAPSYAAQLISTIGTNAVNELRFQFPKRYQRQLAFEGTGPQPVLAVSGVANFGGSDQTGFVFTEKTPEFSDNLSYNLGTHSLKAGGDFRFIRDQQTAAVYAKYTFASIQDYLDATSGKNPKSYTNYTQLLGNPDLKYNSMFSGLYVQDNWKVRPNITLNYGLRYDFYQMPPADKNSLFPASQSFSLDKNNFAPRVGLAWTPGKDQKTVFRMNGGIFYDAPQTDIYRKALLNNGTPQYFNLSTGPGAAFAPAFPAIFSAPPAGFNLGIQDITTVAPDFRTLYTANLNFQVTRELSTNFALTAGYLFTKGTHLPVYRNINLVPGGSVLADGRPIFAGARVYPQLGNILMDESAGNSNYNGLNLLLNRRFARGYEFFVSYTWSHALDNAPEQNNLDSGSNIPADPANRRRDYGNGLSDRRHWVSASGVLDPRVNVEFSKALNYLANHNQLALVFNGGSGDIFNVGSNRVLNGDPTVPSAMQRPLYLGRNTVRGPRIFEINMRYSRLFPIREQKRVEFFGEFTNLFNHSNYTTINTTASVDALGNITSPPNLARTAAMDPRLMQLGFRFLF
jgi:hypothetical protein